MLAETNFVRAIGAVMNKKHFKMAHLDIPPSHFSIFYAAFKEVISYE